MRWELRSCTESSSGNKEHSKEMLPPTELMFLSKQLDGRLCGFSWQSVWLALYPNTLALSSLLQKKKKKWSGKAKLLFTKTGVQQFCFASCQKVLWDCFVIMLYDCKIEATLLLKPSADCSGLGDVNCCPQDTGWIWPQLPDEYSSGRFLGRVIKPWKTIALHVKNTSKHIFKGIFLTNNIRNIIYLDIKGDNMVSFVS